VWGLNALPASHAITKGVRGLLPVAIRLSAGATLFGLASGVASATLFGLSLLVSWRAGVVDLGRFGLAVAIGSVVGGIIDLGTDRMVTQRIAEKAPSWPAAWRALLMLKVGFFGAATLLAALFWIASSNSLPFLILCYAAATSAWLTVQALASGLSRLGWLAAARVISRVGGFVTFGAFLLSQPHQESASAYALAFVAIWDLGGVVALWFGSMKPGLTRIPGIAADLSGTKRALQEALPLGVSAVATWLYVKLDTIILAWFSDLATLGAYTAAVRLAELLGGFSTALNAVLLPAFARISAKDSKYFQAARDIIIIATALFIGLACLLTYFFADTILAVTYRLPGSAPYLRILIWGQIFGALGAICGAALQIQGLGMAIARIATITAAISLPLYVIFIHFGGATGAAIATVISYGMILPVGLAIPASRRTLVAFLRGLVVPAPALMLGGIAFSLSGGFQGRLWLSAAVGASTYGLVSVAGGLGLLFRRVAR
jgi:O-antigen/teichoic acid export membrane protein